MGMIDLHMHILPGLDDGAVDRAMSIEMAKMAVASGTDTIVATVHSYGKREYYARLPQDIYSATEALNGALKAEGVPLTVHAGMEVLLDSSMLSLLRDERLLTLGGTRWLLTEFYGNESANEMTALLRAVLERGYRPLIAHAERYKVFQKHTSFAETVLDMGCAIQVNAHSVSGESDRKYVKTARRLCERGWAQIVASDGHNSTFRPPFLHSAWEWLAEHYSPMLADRLTKDNPKALLSDCMPSQLR